MNDKEQPRITHIYYKSSDEEDFKPLGVARESDLFITDQAQPPFICESGFTANVSFDVKSSEVSKSLNKLLRYRLPRKTKKRLKKYLSKRSGIAVIKIKYSCFIH